MTMYVYVHVCVWSRQVALQQQAAYDFKEIESLEAKMKDTASSSNDKPKRK